MRNLIVGLFLITLWQPQLYAAELFRNLSSNSSPESGEGFRERSPSFGLLSQADQALLKSVLKITFSATLPIVSNIPNQTLSLDKATNSLRKIAADSDTLQKILLVRDGFYTVEGDLLRAILVTAASSQLERDAFIAGLQYEKCKKWFWECKLPPINSAKLLFKFFSKLRNDIDDLEEKLTQIGVLENNDLSNFDPRSLDQYEPYFQLFVQLEPLIGQLNSFLFNYYAQKSLRDLNPKELRELLEKLISFLSDNENGALGFIRKAQPRS
ncbi:MAG: hypothetical protein WCK49_00235 [Myxococcaceae bacterium]